WHGRGRRILAAAGVIKTGTKAPRERGTKIARARPTGVPSFVCVANALRSASARRPGHLPSAHQVQVEVVHSLAAFFAGVHDDPVAVRQALLAGNLRRSPQQVAEQRALLRSGLIERANMLARDN